MDGLPRSQTWQLSLELQTGDLPSFSLVRQCWAVTSTTGLPSWRDFFEAKHGEVIIYEKLHQDVCIYIYKNIN